MLRITRQSDYGILVLSHLANVGGGETHAASEVAVRIGLPLPIVSKILKAFVRADILESERGAKGGYRLARPPEEVSVSQIIAALEGPIAITFCSEDSDVECSHEHCCPMRSNWQIINHRIKQTFDSITLAEMAKPDGLAMSQTENSKSGGAS